MSREEPTFTDLHIHIVPGVDDGPRTFEEVLELVRLAHEEGARQLVATPHMFLAPYNNTGVLPLNDAFARLLERLREYGGLPDHGFLSELRFYLGSENYLSPEFLEAVRRRNVLTLNGSRYLLVETTSFLPLSRFEVILRHVLAGGLVPVIAHPERLAAFQEHPKSLSRFVDGGCLVQVNTASLLGMHGTHIKRTALEFLRSGLVHAVASDGHSARLRRPYLLKAYRELERNFPAPDLERWFVTNPAAILKDRPVPA